MVIEEHYLTLVNENDEPVGYMEKMEVHRKALLHRAFSVFIFNGRGDMLLQRRSVKKYHSGGLWTNACCSHPYRSETPEQAAVRRVREELGIEVVVTPAFSFIYKAALDNGLTEYEFDHVLIGKYEGPINANTDEVGDHRYMAMGELKNSLRDHPEKYTAWFKIAFPLLEQHLSTTGSVA
jgi:isopentenyl-diphosphate delta-isomerase